MAWRFLKHYGMQKATELVEDFTGAVVAFDPEAASKAEISRMESDLNQLGNRLAEAEIELRRERQETLALQKKYDEYLQAATLLDAQAKETEDSERKYETQSGLAKIVATLEQIRPELEREQQEDREAEEWRAELRDAFEALARKVRGAHAELKSARRQMDMAHLRRQRALERHRRTAGFGDIANSVETISVALQAMNRLTTQAKTETEAIDLRTDILGHDNPADDPIVAAALATARGEAKRDSASLSERLAALGNQPTKLKSAA